MMEYNYIIVELGKRIIGVTDKYNVRSKSKHQSRRSTPLESSEETDWKIVCPSHFSRGLKRKW